MGVLVSGAGSNLRALIAASQQPQYPARVVAVAGNRPSSPGLGIGAEARVPVRCFPVSDFDGDAVARDSAMADWLRQEGASLLVLAGYDRVLTAPLLDAFPGAILNLHNSLLPAFAGTMRAVEMALEHGVKVSGCTVHLVDNDFVDGGPIVLQAPVPVLDDDTPETLRRRIHQEEWRILPEAVALLAGGRISVEGRRVIRAAS